MDSDHKFGRLAKNQDLFRASFQDLDKQAFLRALRWLRGEAPYPYPTSIHLDLTLRCTARCVHCRQWTWPSHSEFTISQLQDLFDIFESWGVKSITFGGGNPLLHEHVGLAVQMADTANMEVGIVSEGIDMTDELAEAICQYAHWIRFSLDGPNSDIHDKIRNAPGVFDRAISCIKKLRTRQSQLSIGLNCVVQKSNLKSLSLMVDLAERIGVDVLLFKIAHGEDHDGRFLLSMKEWEQFREWAQVTSLRKDIRVRTNLNQLNNLIDFVFCGEDAVRGKPVRSFYSKAKVRCFAPLFFLTCSSEGSMYPCDYLQFDTRSWNGGYGDMRNEFYLGNVLENSQRVLDNLAILMQKRVHRLPTNGYDECGCCTRFCQLNAALSEIYCELQSEEITEEVLARYFPKAGEIKFL